MTAAEPTITADSWDVGESISISLSSVLLPQSFPPVTKPLTQEVDEKNDTKLAALFDTAAARTHMTQLGLTLLEMSVGRGWTHIAGSVLQGMQRLGFTYKSLSRTSSTRGPGMSFPQRALRCGNTAMLTLVLGWEGEEVVRVGSGTPTRGLLGRGMDGVMCSRVGSVSGSEVGQSYTRDASTAELSFKQQASQQTQCHDMPSTGQHGSTTLLQQYGRSAVAAAAGSGSGPVRIVQSIGGCAAHRTPVSHQASSAMTALSPNSAVLASNVGAAALQYSPSFSAQLHPFQPPYFPSHPHNTSTPFSPGSQNSRHQPAVTYTTSPSRSNNGAAVMAHDNYNNNSHHSNGGNGPLLSGGALSRTKSWLSRSLNSPGTSPPPSTVLYSHPATLVEDVPTGSLQQETRWVTQQTTHASSHGSRQHHVPSLLTHAAAALQARPPPTKPTTSPLPSPFNSGTGYYHQVGTAGMLSHAASHNSIASQTSNVSHNSLTSINSIQEHSPTLFSLKSLPAGGSPVAHVPLAPRVSFPVHGTERHNPSFGQISLAYRSAPVQKAAGLVRRIGIPSASETTTSGITSVVCNSQALSLASLLQLYKTPNRIHSGSGVATVHLLPPQPARSDREAYLLFVGLRTAPLLQVWFVVMFGVLIGLLDFAIRSDRVRGPIQILPYLACHCLCAGWMLFARGSFTAHREDILSALAVARVACLVILPVVMGRRVMVLLQPPVWRNGMTLAAAVLEHAAFAWPLLLPVVCKQVGRMRMQRWKYSQLM